jgi:hypothetical protein
VMPYVTNMILYIAVLKLRLNQDFNSSVSKHQGLTYLALR